MFRQVLERAGYNVSDAPDGMEGMKLIRQEPADLVITDILMPEKDGVETIIDLKREFPLTKIIAVSGGGHLDPEDYLAHRNLGIILGRLGKNDEAIKMIEKANDLQQAMIEKRKKEREGGGTTAP